MCGPNDEQTINAGLNYATSLVDNKLYAQAKPATRKVLKIARRVLGESGDLTIFATASLSHALWNDPAASLADAREAERLMADALKMATRAFGPQHPQALARARHLAGMRADLPFRQFQA